MLSYRPPSRRYALGQFEGLTSGITAGLAKQIVSEGEPVVRRIVKEERNRFAEALIGGIPFGILSALAFVASKYVIPKDMEIAKAGGYLVSAGAAAWGAWWVISHLQEEAPTPLRIPTGPSVIDPYIQKTSKAIIAEAEPKVRAIMDDERRRIAEAGIVALPFAVGAVATFLATLFLVDPDNKLVKAAGYTGTTLLLGAGAWFALEKEKGVT